MYIGDATKTTIPGIVKTFLATAKPATIKLTPGPTAGPTTIKIPTETFPFTKIPITPVKLPTIPTNIQLTPAQYANIMSEVKIYKNVLIGVRNLINGLVAAI